MRIVYLVNSRWPNIRGAERLLFAFLEYGRSQGHEVTVLAPEGSAVHDVCRQMQVRSVVADFTPVPWTILRLKAILRELRPDIVHGMSIFPVALIRRFRLVVLDGSVGCFAYVSTDPSSSLPVASAHFRGLLLAVRNAISRAEAPRLDAIFAASQTIGERLSAVGIRGRVIAIPGVIDIATLTRQAQVPLSLPEGRPRIGYVAFLEKLKGIDDLITAFAEVSKKHPTAVLLIAGEGPERESLTRLAEELGVGSRVHLLGYVDPVAPFLAALDVFVSPSHSESLGISILEAMAVGVPCVCTDSGGPSEILNNEVNGLLVPPHDPPAMAVAIGRLLEDPGLASRLAEGGHASIASGKYSLDSTLKTVFAEYAGVGMRNGSRNGS